MSTTKGLKKYDIVKYICKDHATRIAAITGFNMDGSVDMAYVELYDGKNVRVIYEYDVSATSIISKKLKQKSILPYKLDSLVRYHVDENNYFAANIVSVGPVDTVKLRLGESFVTNARTDYKTGDTVEVNVRDIYLVENVFDQYDTTNINGKNAYEPSYERELEEKKETRRAGWGIVKLFLALGGFIAISYYGPRLYSHLKSEVAVVEDEMPKGYKEEDWDEYKKVLKHRSLILNEENLGPIECGLSVFFDKDFSDISVEELSRITQIEIQMDWRGGSGESYFYTVYVYDKNIEKNFEMDFYSKQAIDTYNFASLPNLSRLRIRADSLKTISFVNEMSSLNTLILDVRDLTDLEPLSKSRIETLELSLSGDNIAGIGRPILDMQNLKCLHVDRGASIFKDVEGVNESVVEFEAGNFSIDYDYLAHFPNLEKVTIVTGDFIITEGVRSIGADNLPKLKSISITGAKLAEDFSGFLNKPSLEEVYLDNCSINIEFDKLIDNPNLKTFQWKESEVLFNVRDDEFGSFYHVYGDRGVIRDHFDMLSHYPNLTSLAITGENLDNLDVFLQYPDLEELDISDNQIKSLEPLKDLTKLRSLKVTNNPLGADASRYGLPSTVEIEK